MFGKNSILFRNFSTRYYLIPVILIIFFFSFNLVYEDIKKRTIQDFDNEQLILASTASRGIVSFFDEFHSDMLFLSHLDDLISITDPGKKLLADYFNAHKGVITAITRVSAKGLIQYTYPEDSRVLGSDISYQAHVQKLIQTKEPVISDVFLAAQGYWAIAYHVPVFKDNEFAGSLAVLIPITELGRLYLGNIRIRGTGNIWLITEEGVEIYCHIKNHNGKSFLENSRKDPTVVELLEKIKNSENGTAKAVHLETIHEGVSDFSDKFIVFYRIPLNNTYWTILISYHGSDIYNSLTRLRNRLLLIFTLLFLIVSYYFYSLARVRNVLNEEQKRKKAEKTLQKSEEKFRRLFEDNAAIELLIDADSGKIVDANNAALSYYGWSREELKRMKVDQINTLPPEKVKEKLEDIRTNKKNQFEFRHRLKDGTIRDVEVYSSKIEIEGKDILYSIIHDISDRKQVEKNLIKAKEKAEESDRLKTAFLQNMSHEIRTPMNAIMGFSSLLPENYNNRENLEKFSDIITSRSNDLLNIINDILDISKIESGQLPVYLDNCDLDELFDDLSGIYKVHQKRMGKQNISLEIQHHCSSEIKNIVTDKIKLRQIFNNLLGNALKFTESGKIEGGCRIDENNRLIFYVSDTGIGIPADKQEVIFDRFAQLNRSDERLNTGTGLGLSIVKGLIDLLGGKIWLESEINKGTTFYFTIPLQIARTERQTQPESPEIHNYDFSGKTAILVEDDPNNTEYISEVFSNTGLNITYTESGLEAINLASSENADIILMDIRLPDINGYDAIRKIIEIKPEQKIVAQTAYATAEDRQKSLDAGCIDYLSKPLKRELLLQTIEKHLSKK